MEIILILDNINELCKLDDKKPFECPFIHLILLLCMHLKVNIA